MTESDQGTIEEIKKWRRTQHSPSHSLWMIDWLVAKVEADAAVITALRSGNADLRQHNRDACHADGTSKGLNSILSALTAELDDAQNQLDQASKRIKKLEASGSPHRFSDAMIAAQEIKKAFDAAIVRVLPQEAAENSEKLQDEQFTQHRKACCADKERMRKELAQAISDRREAWEKEAALRNKVETFLFSSKDGAAEFVQGRIVPDLPTVQRTANEIIEILSKPVTSLAEAHTIRGLIGDIRRKYNLLGDDVLDSWGPVGCGV